MVCLGNPGSVVYQALYGPLPPSTQSHQYRFKNPHTPNSPSPFTPHFNSPQHHQVPLQPHAQFLTIASSNGIFNFHLLVVLGPGFGNSGPFGKPPILIPFGSPPARLVCPIPKIPPISPLSPFAGKDCGGAGGAWARTVGRMAVRREKEGEVNILSRKTSVERQPKQTAKSPTEHGNCGRAKYVYARRSNLYINHPQKKYLS